MYVYHEDFEATFSILYYYNKILLIMKNNSLCIVPIYADLMFKRI